MIGHRHPWETPTTLPSLKPNMGFPIEGSFNLANLHVECFSFKETHEHYYAHFFSIVIERGNDLKSFWDTNLLLSFHAKGWERLASFYAVAYFYYIQIFYMNIHFVVTGIMFCMTMYGLTFMVLIHSICHIFHLFLVSGQLPTFSLEV